MTKGKVDDSFGLDSALIAELDWDRALSRVLHDLRSDFVWAPHLQFIFRYAGNELIAQVRAELESGTFHPGVPITIEVPKSFRIRVGGKSKRLGPSYSRPGSILPPKDRLLYQCLADEAASIVEKSIDKKRSFSHRVAKTKAGAMFVPARECWTALQKALKEHVSMEEHKYLLKVDVANYFGSINQHSLINALRGAGYPASLANPLEKMLTVYTGHKSSRGILQGLYPSDLFGSFYMRPIDRFFDDINTASARYVDDIYVFIDGLAKANDVMRSLIPELRVNDLTLNEAKSSLIPKSLLNAEEPDLEELFAGAVAELEDNLAEIDVDMDYGFQKDWSDDEEAEDPPDIELEATKQLFDSIDSFPGHEESIERFCLPLFTKLGSDHALEVVMASFRRRPAMAQIYCAYLAKFIDEEENVQDFMLEQLDDESLFDWQRMWIIATLHQMTEVSDSLVKVANGILKDGERHNGLRAVAAIFVGRFGDFSRRKALFDVYGTVPEYVQAAIYFSSRDWPGPEKVNAKSSWGGQNGMNKLLSRALANRASAKA